MKKLIYVLIFTVLINTFLSAAGSREVETTLQIEDTTGNTAHLNGIPQRITFVGKASNMIADALYMFPEASTRIVGVGNTNQRNGDFVKVLDSNYNSKVYLEHTVGPEQIAVTRPELVIIKNYLKKSIGDPVSQLDIPVLYMNLETPEAYEEDFRILGRVFGNPERAVELIKYYRIEKEFVTNRTQSLTDRPDILFIYHTTRDGIAAFNTPPGTWIQSTMVEMAGGNPVWTDSHPGGGWSKINLEQIAAWNPDQIYVVAYKEDINVVLNSMKDSPEWQELDAVKNNKLQAFPVDFYSWDQPDSRWILGLKWLAKQIHPDLFPDVDIQKMTRAFFKDLYFLTDEQYETEILSKLGW
ncbi:MAG: ABC transporter substrate-binding protein [Spirochaetota bacterium]|nr:ABC transporter substrate-binding protein [Spirochaetota bacterium]